MSNKVEILKFLKASPKSRIIFANYRRVIEGRRSWKDWDYQRCHFDKKNTDDGKSHLQKHQEHCQTPPGGAASTLVSCSEPSWGTITKSFYNQKSIPSWIMISILVDNSFRQFGVQSLQAICSFQALTVYDGRPLFWISDYDDADCVMDKVRIDGSWAVY